MDDTDSQLRLTSPLFLPFILLAASVLLSLVWQIATVQAQRSNFKTTKAQLAETIQKREPQVAQATEIKNGLEALANDLLELSKTNPNAAAIVKKYNIQRNLEAAGTAAKAGK